MWFKHRAWIPTAWFLSVVNLVSVWFAAQPAEPWHATIHGLLAVLFGLGGQRLTARRQVMALHEHLQQALDQNEHLQLDLDGMQGRLQELEERLDHAERLLVKHRDAGGSAPPP